MPAALLLAFREGLEAALILGIVLRYLARVGRPELRRDVWLGALTAIGASLPFALGIQTLGWSLSGRAEEIFEGATMVLAVLVLTWMIFWMSSQARWVKSSLEQDVKSAVERGQRWGLWAVAFLAVFREGLELVLFLSAASFASGGDGTILGSVLGLSAAALIGVLVYSSTRRLNPRWFFRVTSVLLLIFSAGLLAHAVHEFQEAGLLSTVQEHVWDVNHVLHEQSPVGQILGTLVGYNGNPSLEEVVAYGLYWVAMVLGVRFWVNRKPANRSSIQAT